jgi:hypothetical protein
VVLSADSNVGVFAFSNSSQLGTIAFWRGSGPDFDLFLLLEYCEIAHLDMDEGRTYLFVCVCRL